MRESGGGNQLSQTDLKGEGSILVVFIPHDDDTFSSSSHECVHIVSTEDGDYVFSRRLTTSGGNTPQSDWKSDRYQCVCGTWMPNHELVCVCGESSPKLKEMQRAEDIRRGHSGSDSSSG